MAISKRLRFEILRRDGHACRYCGRTAPEVKLTIDHVVPLALGGTDDPTNLVTACAECNAGKSSAAASDEMVADAKGNADKWSAAIKAIGEQRVKGREDVAAEVEQFREEWDVWSYTNTENKGEKVPLPSDWRHSIEKFLLDGLPIQELKRLVAVTMNARLRNNYRYEDREWRYFCGCCKNVLADIHKEARALLEATDSIPPSDQARPN